MSRTAANTLSLLAAGAEQLVITDNLLTLGDGVVMAPHSSDNFTIDSPNGIVLDGTSATNGVQYHDGGTELLRIQNSSSNPIIRTMQDSKDLIFQQFDATEVMRITDNATVGIGTTSPLAAAKLTLSDATNTYLNFKPQATHNNWTIGADASGFVFYDETVGGYRMSISDAGYVGIGTTSPGAPLHVNTTANAYGIDLYQSAHPVMRLLNNDTAGNAELRMYAAANTTAVEKIRLEAAGDTFFNGGDVGIGVTSPDAKLHIDALSEGDGLIVETDYSTGDQIKVLKDGSTS